MIRIYFLACYLLLGSFMLSAQITPPCNNFNNPVTPEGNWAPAPAPHNNVFVNFPNTTPVDGSPYLKIVDDQGSSWYVNNTDFKYIGEMFQNRCLSFDFYYETDDGNNPTAPIHPNIYLSDGINNIRFDANVSVTPGSGWVHINAPIQLTYGGPIPSNADGTWTWIGPSPFSPAAFDNIMLNSTTLSITPDYYSGPGEVVYYDNICVTNCTPGCSADFKLDTTFNTQNNIAIANLTIFNPLIVSTSGNPGSTYSIDWGDGTAITSYTLPSISHTYNNPGTYTICVTEARDREIICKRCFTFCYLGNEGSAGKQFMQNSKSSFLDVKAIAEAELNSVKEVPKEYLLVPNPAKNNVNIQTNLSQKDTVSVRVLDISGKKVLEKSETVESGRQHIKLNTEKLIQGTYIVEITSNGKTTSQKLLISK